MWWYKDLTFGDTFKPHDVVFPEKLRLVESLWRKNLRGQLRSCVVRVALAKAILSPRNDFDQDHGGFVCVSVGKV